MVNANDYVYVLMGDDKQLSVHSSQDNAHRELSERYVQDRSCYRFYIAKLRVDAPHSRTVDVTPYHLHEKDSSEDSSTNSSTNSSTDSSDDLTREDI